MLSRLLVNSPFLSFSQEGVDGNLVPLWVKALSSLPELEEELDAPETPAAETTFDWEKSETPLPPRLQTLFEKAAKADFGQRRSMLDGLPVYQHLTKAPPNNTLRTIPFDRCCVS